MLLYAILYKKEPLRPKMRPHRPWSELTKHLQYMPQSVAFESWLFYPIKISNVPANDRSWEI